ncbi:MAG TPA: hypothetical protein DEF35_12630 [Paenibacillus sp.]|uniref:IS3 family transposase n=1 Tax=Paenibacillus sp. TaxID=58172 RepID=UPI000BA0834C|nr:hypothetical protein CA599_30120 [Paenibacillus taichungensis]HBU82465.1 hypothetical protein [Paenibacillus sp.]
MESFFSHLKTEKIYLNKAANKAEVEQQMSEYILFYNQNRFQKKLEQPCVSFAPFSMLLKYITEKPPYDAQLKPKACFTL